MRQSQRGRIAIDRESYEPAYAQLVNILRRQIAAGEYRPGSRLPSEAQLCREYEVSPMTVRRAINVLLDQQIVVTSQGKGTFVKPLGLGTGIFGLQELTALLEEQGRTSVRLLQASVLPADERTARKLSVPEGTRTIYLRRLLLKDQDPVLYHQEYLVYDPTRPTVEAEMEVTSLRGLFAGTGESDFKGGVLTIEATTLTAEEAKLLAGTAGQAAFRVAHKFYDFNDRPGSWGWFICRGDRIKFRATVGMWSELEADLKNGSGGA
ncbi:MAG: GntR family transcriptional regulator [Deltaproteobacteria bacterium]|nr:GntR family transcriptional regulator [Deltaproteobacteria bacterium]